MSSGVGGSQPAEEKWEKEGIPGGGNSLSKRRSQAQLGVGWNHKSFSHWSLKFSGGRGGWRGEQEYLSYGSTKNL